jgi:hypothetical protein
MFLKEIWCEGDPRRDYTACHLGYGKGRTLLEACEDLASKRESFARSFNPTSMTYYGCKIFDNEVAARDLWN